MKKNKKVVLENKVFTIFGKRGSGKTMLASILAYDYNFIFCNYDLIIKKKIIKKFKDFDLYNKIDKNDLSKKCLIYDEGAINLSNRNFQSKINKLLSYFIFVSRKFNIDLYFITQNYETIDINIRRQTDYTIFVNGIFKNQLDFEISKNIDGNIEHNKYLGNYSLNPFNYMKLNKIEYDTRDLSGFEEKLKTFI